VTDLLSKPFTDYTAADYALITGVNLTGLFWLTPAGHRGNAQAR
jgi:hypothetical protein